MKPRQLWCRRFLPPGASRQGRLIVRVIPGFMVGVQWDWCSTTVVLGPIEIEVYRWW